MKTQLSSKILFFTSAIVFLSLPVIAKTNSIKIKISKGSYSDEAVIRFMPDATENFDGCCDARKMFSPKGSVPNIFTKIANEDKLTINTLPPLSTSFAIGLFIGVSESGDYSFKSSEPNSFDPGVCIMMFDQETGNIYNLRDVGAVNTISLPVISKDDEARFILIFSLPTSVSVTEPTCTDCKDGEASVKKAGWSNWQYAIKDSSGIVLESGTASTDNVEIKGYYPGLYVAVVESQFFTCSDSISFRVPEFHNTLGINNNLFAQECKFNYYGGSFQLETNFSEEKDFTAQIIDITGKRIWEKDFSDVKQLNNTIQIGNLASGVYVGIIQGNDFSAVRKIMISR
ncbi:MAG: T9SS type A sorting domain-containing protein [Bacteroidetes bacterium]|nr:T9SS type A sorting domain-containing protein [Bacteroidota bacterium]